MYEYIIGCVKKIVPKYIVLENNGIGYILIVSNPYSFNIGDNLCVYTYQHVREDINDLYGFKTEEEKDLFIKLLSVNGIGPKSALSILAADNVSNVIDAIETGNDQYLRKFPGIGSKSSQQIILDLKGKLRVTKMETLLDDKKLDDCIEALVTLGYSKKDISKIMDRLDINKDEGYIIREALRLLNS